MTLKKSYTVWDVRNFALSLANLPNTHFSRLTSSPLWY